jgi:hypothetical protein
MPVATSAPRSSPSAPRDPKGGTPCARGRDLGRQRTALGRVASYIAVVPAAGIGGPPGLMAAQPRKPETLLVRRGRGGGGAGLAKPPRRFAVVSRGQKNKSLLAEYASKLKNCRSLGLPQAAAKPDPAERRRRRLQARRPPQAKIRPGNPAPTTGPGTETVVENDRFVPVPPCDVSEK